jgi:hypothetical protein
MILDFGFWNLDLEFGIWIGGSRVHSATDQPKGNADE